MPHVHIHKMSKHVHLQKKSSEISGKRDHLKKVIDRLCGQVNILTTSQASWQQCNTSSSCDVGDLTRSTASHNLHHEGCWEALLMFFSAALLMQIARPPMFIKIMLRVYV